MAAGCCVCAGRWPLPNGKRWLGVAGRCWLAREWSVRRSERASASTCVSDCNRFLFRCECGCTQTRRAAAGESGQVERETEAAAATRRGRSAVLPLQPRHTQIQFALEQLPPSAPRQSQSVSQPVEWRVAQKKGTNCFFVFFPTICSLVFGTSVTHEFISINHKAISLKLELSMKDTLSMTLAEFEPIK